MERLERTLSPDERERAARFHFARDRRRFVAGRAILRAILALYLRVEPTWLAFQYGPGGKPALADAEDAPSRMSPLRFNVAHSQGLALYAVSHGRRIGVDLEWIRPLPDAEQIAERFFSPAERAALRALPADRRLEAFFTCWTRKEAYLKATGDGLARPLDQFDVTLAPGAPAALLRIEGEPDGPARWRLAALAPAPDYVAALAVEGQDWRLTRWLWPG